MKRNDVAQRRAEVDAELQGGRAGSCCEEQRAEERLRESSIARGVLSDGQFNAREIVSARHGGG